MSDERDNIHLSSSRPIAGTLSQDAGIDASTAGSDGVMVPIDLEAIGNRIRSLRMDAGLTLQQVSARCNLSVSMLSAVERGRANPSIGTLAAITQALGVQIANVFDAVGNGVPSPVIRRSEHPIFVMHEGVRRRLLMNDLSRGVVLGFTEYQPMATSSPTPVRHQGYECGVVLEGQLTVELDEQTYKLEPLDVIGYASPRAHRTLNPGPGVTRVVWINLKFLS